MEVTLRLQGVIFNPGLLLTHGSDTKESLLPVSLKVLTDLSCITGCITGDSVIDIGSLWTFSSCEILSPTLMLHPLSVTSHW